MPFSPDLVLESLSGGSSVPLKVEAFNVSHSRLSPQQYSDGTARGYDVIDPELELVYEQSSWHRGAGQPLVQRRGQDDFRYALANGVITFNEGGFSTGYDAKELEFPAEYHTDNNPRWAKEPVIFNDTLYTFYDHSLLYWDGTNFELEETFAHQIQDIAVFKGFLYLAFGVNGHMRSRGGSRGRMLWPIANDKTAESGSTSAPLQYTAGKAHQFVLFSTARNSEGAKVLAGLNVEGKVRLLTGVAKNWSSGTLVDEADSQFSVMLEANGTLYIGGESGLFVYDGEKDAFRNIEPELGFVQDRKRYRHLVSRAGLLYGTRGDNSVWEISDDGQTVNIRDLRNVLSHPAYIGMSGEAHAIAQDSLGVWFVLAATPLSSKPRFPYTDFDDTPIPIPEREPANVDSYYRTALMKDGHSHVIDQFEIGEVHSAVRYAGSDSDYSLMIVFGVSGSVPKVRIMYIPTDADTPYRSLNRRCRQYGWLSTPWIDFFYPDVDKTLVRASLLARNLDVALRNPLEVFYRLDDDREAFDDANWGHRLHVYNPTTISSGFFRMSPALGTYPSFKRIRFKIQLSSSIDSTGSGTIPALVESFVAHAIFSNEALRVFKFRIKFTRDGSGVGVERRVRAELESLKNDNVVLKMNKVGNRLHWLPDNVYVRIRGIEDQVGSNLFTAERVDTGPDTIESEIELVEVGLI